MDLLGSILSSMDKPPSISDKQKALIKKQKEDHEKRQKADAEKLKKFKEEENHRRILNFLEYFFVRDMELFYTMLFYTLVEERINKFLKDDAAKEYKFPPMDNVYRSVIHDVAEVANVLAYSFGEEGVDRYIMIFKREHAPSEDQLNTLRRGKEWNEEVGKRMQEDRKRLAKEEFEEAMSKKRKDNFVPTSFYKDKYQHLIGKDAALQAARKTEANSSYGCVPSENKKDQRSIEQTLADIRAKKRKLDTANIPTKPDEHVTK